MPISTSQIKTIFVKHCIVWSPGFVIQNFLFVLIQCLHYDHLLKLAEVYSFCSACMCLHALLYVCARAHVFVCLSWWLINNSIHYSDLNEIRPILPQLLDGKGWFELRYLLAYLMVRGDLNIFWLCFHWVGIFLSAEFFKLMNEVENEDLVFTLETIVDKFGEEMAPYALGLCQNLVIHVFIILL